MKRSTLNGLWLTRLVTLSLVLLFSGLAIAQDLKFMTGPMGGAWYPLAGALVEKFKPFHPKSNIAVVPGTGTLNVEMLDQAKAQMAITNLVSTYDGLGPRPPFKQKIKNVSHVASLYYNYFHLATSADFGINSLADMKGKGLLPGTRGSTMEPLVAKLLELYGLTYKDMGRVDFVSYNDGVNMLRNKQSHLMSSITPLPTPHVVELASSLKLKLLSIPEDKIDEIKKWNPGYTRAVIPANSYSNQKEPVVTVGNYCHLIVTASLSDQLVYDLTKVLIENLKDLSLVVADLKNLTPKEAAADVGIPMHPGALKYYKEKGLR